MPQLTVDFKDPTRVGAKFVLMEGDFAREGAPTFHAHAPVIDWGAVKAQMLMLHGCVKITRDGRSA